MPRWSCWAAGGRSRAAPASSSGQFIVLFAQVEASLSAPEEAFACSAKYQVPVDRPFTVYVVSPALSMSTL